MADPNVLEIASLPQRHPTLALFEVTATPLILRLSIDPIRLPSGCTAREVDIEHRTGPASTEAVNLTRTVDWSNLGNLAGDACVRYQRTLNDKTLTELAALGMMGLVAHEFERLTIVEVLQIGSGGDYRVRKAAHGSSETQVEVSGIREDLSPTGTEARSRVEAKTDQLLRISPSGIVSVTTFAYSAARKVKSHLFCVKRTEPPGAASRRRRKRK